MDYLWTGHSRDSRKHGISRPRLASAPNRELADIRLPVCFGGGGGHLRGPPSLTHAPHLHYLPAVARRAANRSDSARIALRHPLDRPRRNGGESPAGTDSLFAISNRSSSVSI